MALNLALANPELNVLRTSLLASLLLSPLLPVVAAACEPWSESFNNREDLLVGQITLDVNDVFNQRLPNENHEIHRIANRFHIQSRDTLIEAQLLFAEGDVFEPDLLAETERNLRRNEYLRRANVTPDTVCDNYVNVLVETGDNWSLLPSMNFSRAGGENEFAFSLSEVNLLGLGKTIGFGLDFGRVRDQRVLQYFDPMLLGSKTQLTAQLQHNTDGEVQLLKFAQPFTSLDSRQSWEVKAANFEFEQSIYADGARIGQFAIDNEYIAAQRGFSQGKKLAFRKENGDPVFRITRFSAGWHYERYGLGTTDLFPENTAVPMRVFSYPFIEMSLLQPNFIEQSNLQLMESVEDINVGHTLKARIGFAAEAFGSSKDSLQAELSYERGWQHGDRFLSLIDTELDGFITSDGIENGVARTTLEGFYFFSRKSQFHAKLNAAVSSDLFENRQILIGGATGLRGYPLNFQTGTRRTRFTLEQRYFFDWYPLRLARIGSAAFMDVGSAWSKDEDPDWLSDVGFGLRIVGTRQANARVMHIDFAFPLNETDRIESFQLVVSLKSEF